MLSNKQVSISVSKSLKYLLYRVTGDNSRPLRFDLINMDGRKIRSIDLLYGNEFVIPIKGLKNGEYLYALSSVNGLQQTGVITL